MTSSDVEKRIPMRAGIATAIGAIVETLRPSHLFVYGKANERALAIGRRLEIKVEGREITLGDGARIVHREAATDPFGQVGRLLDQYAPAGWTAYGYFAFDLVGFYHSYRKVAACPSLHLVVPEYDCRFAEKELLVRGADLPDALSKISDLVDGPSPKPSEIRGGAEAEDKRYVDSMIRAQEAIRRGELAKVIVSRRVTTPGRLDLGATAALADANTAERYFAFTLDGVAGVGCPPGMLIEANANGEVSSEILAGTQPRGETPEADAVLARRLLSDAKEVREHAIAIRLAASEIESVCTRETAGIRDFMKVKQQRLVQHLSSRATGTLSPGRTVWDAIRAAFPSVTISGVEKAPAIRMIDELEDMPRGLYAGAVGWVDHRGAADFGIAIRSVFQIGDEVLFNAGAGIVAESSPEDEYLESENKMKTMRTRTRLLR